MKAEELMIGNFIYYSDQNSIDDYMIVTGINKNKVITEWNEPDECDGIAYDLDAIIPIPITDEWLKRFCFLRRTENTHELAPIILIQTGDSFTFLANQRWVHLWYVHQLQNLYFALTGKE